MKRLFGVLLGLGIVVAFIGTLAFLYWKSLEAPVVFETESPQVTDIVKKTVATGAIVPRTEVAIKARVSGVVEEIAVEPGETVAEGDLIARIRIIPDVATLNRAQSSVQTTKLALDDAQKDFDRTNELFGQGAVSKEELDDARLALSTRHEEFRSAVANLQIVKEGAARGSNDVSTRVLSTVSGMVLSTDVKEGESVIESNTFNAGTTIGTIANMDDMIFEGQVDESEVGKIKEGMPLAITIGALEDLTFDGQLEYIAPKGIEEEGAIQFEIRAAIDGKEGVFVRAGCSANADIVLDRREKVLAVKEQVLQFDDDGSAYVELEVSPQSFERRDIEVGLSDGIFIHVESGLTEKDKVKKPNPAGA